MNINFEIKRLILILAGMILSVEILYLISWTIRRLLFRIRIDWLNKKDPEYYNSTICQDGLDGSEIRFS